MTRRFVAGLVGLQAAGAIAASAQGVSLLVPSFGTSIVYDDNVYHRPAAEGDLSVRFSPRLDAIHQSERLALSGRFALGADRFARHPELTTARGREDAALDARYTASRRLSIAGAAAFTETETPADLNEVTALTPGRAQARRVTLHPSATYSLGPRADAGVGYTVTSDTLRGGVSVTTQTAAASIDRHMSARDGLRVEYLEQRFLFGGSQASASRAFTAEWTREVHRGTSLTLRAGPRVTSGVLAPELAVSARHALRAGNISLSYQQTQTTLIGLSGIARAQGLTAAAERELGPRVRLRAASSVMQTRQADMSSRAYRLSGACAWTLAPGIAIEAGYDTDLQRGNLYTAQARQNIRRNLVTVTLGIAHRAQTAAVESR
jgi:hypothetical protein